MVQAVKNPAIQETQEICVRSLGQEDPLEEEMATHSSIFAWKIPWTKESSGLQPRGSQRVGHDWASFHLFFFLLRKSLYFFPQEPKFFLFQFRQKFIYNFGIETLLF